MSLGKIKDTFRNKSVAVVGYGVFGRSAVDFLRTCEPSVITVFDNNPHVEIPYQLKNDTQKELSDFDVVLRSPGVPLKEVKGVEDRTITDTELLLEYFRQQVVGVTGTKGKSTTASMLAALLESAGIDVLLAGNIGRSFFDIFEHISKDTVVVAELSSYQLSDVNNSPHWSLLLPIASDHISWHGGQAEYVAAKLNIVKFQQKGDITVLPSEAASGQSQAIWEQLSTESSHIQYGSYSDSGSAIIDSNNLVFKFSDEQMNEYKIIEKDSFSLPGMHNLQNACGAITVAAHICLEWKIMWNQELFEAFGKTLAQFEPLKHHLQEVGQVHGVNFVDDSYASTPVATEAAVRAIAPPKVLIFGGQNRGIDLGNTLSAIRHENTKHVLVIGKDEGRKRQIQQLFTESGVDATTSAASSMEQIVKEAYALAEPGETVLLSPGHPSFDMFENFNDRGDKFQDAVQSLRDEIS